ncbi:hypothetical protein [Paenibacillus sp. GP183]|uniref:RCC1 domain-containing protein n=1 Tax=Paenibacillus sp. GP183 TaxID=1882751 RepID=UPI0008952AA5|nr:hypothetical protein [Paenibacillus sp. GP183]SEC00627.1 Regulator of chromosome condensation (RCC1) repeat-containing protein [Paenibacillus sp. GP183]
MKKHVTIFLIVVLTLLSVPNLSFAGEAPKQLINKVVEISAGASHVLAITESGMLIAWGSNGHGELGDGTNINKTLPVQIGTATDWYKISAGSNYSMAIKKDGTLWAWGNNTYGHLVQAIRLIKRHL